MTATGGPARGKARWHRDGRAHVQTITARATAADGRIALFSPTVGVWRDRPAPGEVVTPGGSVGVLEILGVLYPLCAPADASGVVVDDAGPQGPARIPVDARTRLLTLDRDASTATARPSAPEASAAQSEAGLVFRAPLSGRYYARPAPGEEAFVEVGDVITEGQTVALLEVMKTFNRIVYGGAGLPARAKVVGLGPSDGDDIEEDDVLVRLEPA